MQETRRGLPESHPTEITAKKLATLGRANVKKKPPKKGGPIIVRDD